MGQKYELLTIAIKNFDDVERKSKQLMDARKAQITDIINNNTLVEIPFFQRSYVWKEDLWQRLIEDMEYIVKTHKSHFLGSIILKESRKPLAGEHVTGCRTVVDGQQRLTTFLIFLKVLALKVNQTMWFDFSFKIMGQSIALKHGKNDVDAFEQVMSLNTAEKITDYESVSRIIDAYNYFMDNIDPAKMDLMIIATSTQFVKIDLDENEDEQQIFDTINSLGVNLTTSELLKNYFFSRDTVAEYQTKWEAVFEKDDDTKQYWENEIETGRVKRAMIDIFFDAYFQLFIQDKKYSISNEDKTMYARIDNLAQSYQHFINNYCAGKKEIVIDIMKDYALQFKNTFNPSVCDMNVPGTFGIDRLNVVIFGLKTTTLIPYVLFVANNVSDQVERSKMYGILESYLMRRMIVHATNKNYNNLFTSLILNRVLDSETLLEKLKNSTDATTYVPDNAELKLGFDNSKLINLQTKGIIYLIESAIRPENSSTVLLGFNQYSLEHMMPKKWRNNWPACATVELARERDNKLLTLGNLAIIPQSLNASIRDAAWDVKKSGKGKKPGLDICAAGLITVYEALQKNTWDDTEITERADYLYNEAKELWSL